METKQLNIKVKGKDGFVETSTIQRHKPTAPMLLILLKTGHFLFCQNNHPIYIKDSDDNIKCLDAMYANINEKIYVDNSSCRKYIDKELTKNILDPSETVSNFLNKNFKKLTHMTGDSYSNIRFTPDFIKYDNIWSYIFMYYFIKNISDNESLLKEISNNIIFIQQIKIIADKANIFVKPIFDETVDYLKLLKFEYQYLEDTNILKINDYVEIEKIITINNYDDYVYDIKTITSEFLISNVQTHNSFHVAASASFGRFNIMEELLSYLDDSYLNQINLFFKQVDDDLILKANKCRIKINKKILVDDYKIKYDELKKKYFIPLGYVDIEVGNFTIPLRIEQDINIYDSPEKVETDELLILEFNAKDKIIEVVPRPSHPEKIALKLDELVGGKSPFNSPEELFNKIHKTLQLIGIGYDAVHLEVAISNILRNKKDPQIPARLKEPYEFQTFSVKTLPSKMSWSLGMAFENFGQAISTGLISDRSPASPIEKILFGEPLSELSIELIKKAKNSRK